MAIFQTAFVLLLVLDVAQGLSSWANEAQARLAQLRTQFEQSQSPIINELPGPVEAVPAVEIPPQSAALSSPAKSSSATAAEARLAQLRTQFEQSQSPIVNELPPPVVTVPAVAVPPQTGALARATAAATATGSSTAVIPPPADAMTVKNDMVTTTAPPISPSPQVVSGYKKTQTFALGPETDWELYPTPLSQTWGKHYS